MCIGTLKCQIKSAFSFTNVDVILLFTELGITHKTIINLLLQCVEIISIYEIIIYLYFIRL